MAKQEMTKMWMGGIFAPVTLVKLLPQEIIRYKTQENDGYFAVVVWVWKKELKKEKWEKVKYQFVTEFLIDDDFAQHHEVGSLIDGSVLEGVVSVAVSWTSKGKGFQWLVKRWHVKGGGATHGHKFTRATGSKGNRKPRGTLKWHPHAGHMGAEKITLKKIKIVDSIQKDNEHLFAIKGSLPGARNGVLKFFVE